MSWSPRLYGCFFLAVLGISGSLVAGETFSLRQLCEVLEYDYAAILKGGKVPDDIHSRRRSALLKFHPDKGPGGEEKIRILNYFGGDDGIRESFERELATKARVSGASSAARAWSPWGPGARASAPREDNERAEADAWAEFRRAASARGSEEREAEERLRVDLAKAVEEGNIERLRELYLGYPLGKREDLLRGAENLERILKPAVLRRDPSILRILLDGLPRERQGVFARASVGFRKNLLLLAAEHGNRENVKELLDRVPEKWRMIDFIKLYDAEEQNALQLAALHGHAGVIEELLEHYSGTDFFERGISKAKSALHYAIQKKDARAVKALLSHLSDSQVRFLFERQFDGDTLLHFAASMGSRDVLLVMLNRVSRDKRYDLIFKRNRLGSTVIDMARGSKEKMEALSPILKRVEAARRAQKLYRELSDKIYMAVKGNSTKSLDVILKQARAGLHSKHFKVLCLRALSSAVSLGGRGVITALLRTGTISIEDMERKDEHGSSLVDRSKRNEKHPKVYDFLVRFINRNKGRVSGAAAAAGADGAPETKRSE
jgi:ankyrin repeat protein